MHGDFNFSNILLTEEGDFKLIDWRQDFGGLLEFGDMNYDLAKFYAGLIFPHHSIKKNQYNLSLLKERVEIEIFQDESIKKSTEFFLKFLEKNNISFNKINHITSLVLLSMSPLHEYPLNLLLYYMGRFQLWKSIKERK